MSGITYSDLVYFTIAVLYVGLVSGFLLFSGEWLLPLSMVVLLFGTLRFTKIGYAVTSTRSDVNPRTGG